MVVSHRMKTSPEDVTVLLVGGGSIIAPDALAGVKELIRPPFFSVANAVGAAMAKGLSLKRVGSSMICSDAFCVVAGEVDTIEFLAGRNIEEVIEGLKLQAIQNAVKNGADSCERLSSIELAVI